MTYESVKQQLEELLAVEHPLAEAWTRHEYADTELARFLERVPEAGAAAIPVGVLHQAKALVAELPEPERDRLIIWFIVRMVGSVGTIGPEDIEFEDGGDAE